MPWALRLLCLLPARGAACSGQHSWLSAALQEDSLGVTDGGFPAIAESSEEAGGGQLGGEADG